MHLSRQFPDPRCNRPVINDKLTVKQVRVSELGDANKEILIAVHEIIEWFLATKKGTKLEDIDAFDIQFEKEREKGLHHEDEEPGFDPFCPVFREHAFATKIERMLARELGVDWDEYNNLVNKL